MVDKDLRRDDLDVTRCRVLLLSLGPTVDDFRRNARPAVRGHLRRAVCNAYRLGALPPDETTIDKLQEVGNTLNTVGTAAGKEREHMERLFGFIASTDALALSPAE